MNALRRLFASMLNLAGGLDRLAGLAHETPDAIEHHPPGELPALESPRSARILENGHAEPVKAGGRSKR